MFLIDYDTGDMTSYTYEVFPSPYGDYVSYPLKERTCNDYSERKCFRPLTGIMFLIEDYEEVDEEEDQ